MGIRPGPGGERCAPKPLVPSRRSGDRGRDVPSRCAVPARDRGRPRPGEGLLVPADFANSAEWDPGIVEARRLSEGPTAVGSRFEVIALFRGRRQRFEYIVTEYEEGRRIALRGEGEKALSDDVITISGVDGRTRIAYDADLRLKGVYRVAAPFLRSTFARMGDDALDGLAATLDRAGREPAS